MQTAKAGDHIQVHYIVRLQDGSVTSSEGRAPLEMIVGTNHPRLPGLGLAMVGLEPGQDAKLTVAPENAYGLSDPSRIRRCSREQVSRKSTLQAGKLVRVTTKQGRQRLVRIVKMNDKNLVVDVNHRWAGQTVQMEVKLVSIHGTGAQS